MRRQNILHVQPKLSWTKEDQSDMKCVGPNLQECATVRSLILNFQKPKIVQNKGPLTKKGLKRVSTVIKISSSNDD